MNLTKYTTAELKTALITGTLPTRVRNADGGLVDVVSVPVAREAIEAELAKPGRQPDRILAGNFCAVVGDWTCETVTA